MDLVWITYGFGMAGDGAEIRVPEPIWKRSGREFLGLLVGGGTPETKGFAAF
jgi:hypothetical protein